MFTHPYLASELIRDRQSVMLARADERRLVRKFRNLARASRHAAQHRRPVPQSLRRGRRAVAPS
jgi:hypothetical protein